MAITIGAGITIGQGISLTLPPPPPSFYSYTAYSPGTVKTTDLGTTWTNTGASIPTTYGGQTMSFTVVKNSNGVIIGGAAGIGGTTKYYIFRSTDGLDTISAIELTDKLTNGAPNAIARVGDIWVAATGNPSGNYYSTDNGATWATSHHSYAVGTPVAAGNHSFLAIDATATSAFIKSTDGINWTSVGTFPTFVNTDVYPNITFDGTRWVAINSKGEVAYTPDEDTFTWTTSSHTIPITPPYPPEWVAEGSYTTVGQFECAHFSNGTIILEMFYYGFTADYMIFIQGSGVSAGTASGTWTTTWFENLGASIWLPIKNDLAMIAVSDPSTGLSVGTKISTNGVTWTDATDSGYTSIF